VIGAGSYILSAAALAAVALSLGFAAVRLRRRLLPTWDGAPAHLVEAIIAVTFLIWLSELLGLLSLLYAWTLVASSLVLAGAIALLVHPDPDQPDEGALPAGDASPAGGVEEGGVRTPSPAIPPSSTTGPAGRALLVVVTVGVIAVVVAHWGLTTKDALDRGIFNFDSLWYHMPFATEIAKSHSVTGLHYTETVFTNWLYPQNSELVHAVGIVLTERDTLSLFINFGWLAIALLAAWCIGRPYGRGPHSVTAAAIILECHTLVVREPGAAKNDVVVAALVLAAIAILVNAAGGERGRVSPGWPLAFAGLAVGLAVGTKFTALAMAAALSVAAIALAPAGRRSAAALWWFLPALAAGGFWYLRNLIAAGNPLPQLEHLGPVTLPHPDRLQSGRPDFSILHSATDTDVWRDYFGPGLENAFGVLWPLVIGGAIVGAGLAALRGRDRVLRWCGAVVLFGMLAYLVTPLSAAGAEGAPEGFAINIRYAIPALLAGAALLPLARGLEGERAGWAVLGSLLLVLVVTDRADAVVRDPSRVFGLPLAILVVLVPAALLLASRRRGLPGGATAAGLGAIALAVVAIGYPVQRDYLEDRFGPGSEIPGMGLNPAYHWARDTADARIGLAGTTAGFLQFGFYGTDLSNRVRYLGTRGPHGAFNAIPTCADFRAAVNDAELDYLVTAPFLNFIDPGEPIASPEAAWLRGEPAVEPVLGGGEAIVWRVGGRLDPAGFGPANEPLRRIPQQPVS
jgi:hypothetical protein